MCLSRFKLEVHVKYDVKLYFRFAYRTFGMNAKFVRFRVGAECFVLITRLLWLKGVLKLRQLQKIIQFENVYGYYGFQHGCQTLGYSLRIKLSLLC